MIADTLVLPVIGEPKQRNVCVVRIRTTAWSDRSGLHFKKSLVFLRKQCVGFNVLEEDVGMIGAEEVIPRIINIDECENGVYQVVVCNESRDWETGCVDDFDYRLIPMPDHSSTGPVATE